MPIIVILILYELVYDLFNLKTILITSIIFSTLNAFIERFIKELWVKFYSFQMSEKMFKLAFESSPIASFVLDKQSRVLYFNDQG